MADYTISADGTLTIKVKLSEGFIAESTSGKTQPAVDAAGMARKIRWGVYKGKVVEGSLQVYLPVGGSSERAVVKL